MTLPRSASWLTFFGKADGRHLARCTALANIVVLRCYVLAQHRYGVVSTGLVQVDPDIR